MIIKLISILGVYLVYSSVANIYRESLLIGEKLMWFFQMNRLNATKHSIDDLFGKSVIYKLDDIIHSIGVVLKESVIVPVFIWVYLTVSGGRIFLPSSSQFLLAVVASVAYISIRGNLLILYGMYLYHKLKRDVRSGSISYINYHELYTKDESVVDELYKDSVKYDSIYSMVNKLSLVCGMILTMSIFTDIYTAVLFGVTYVILTPLMESSESIKEGYGWSATDTDLSSYNENRESFIYQTRLSASFTFYGRIFKDIFTIMLLKTLHDFYISGVFTVDFMWVLSNTFYIFFPTFLLGSLIFKYGMKNMEQSFAGISAPRNITMFQVELCGELALLFKIILIVVDIK